ncbi:MULTISPECIES: polyprenyl synthetase family protein [unclassified Campylobacter]|uniref:polyprenyl synthetase family protein n=1 Tax=unclassified Campylobacter TaxID=2593542 RepID=UPI0022E9BD5C|nr:MULTISPECIES: polyprenyl synthetase family protein [unclassified Campylobacter]MDA3060781.1 polyprenyl synthetase family protein [Campylobacter sp. VBCF_02 NA5]MDA3069952.1 polyprenyl synthetase family protein [Campylobacter sp. VBCF_08 NA3]
MEILKEFKEYLRENPLHAPSFHPYFEEALNYMLGAGGKHFRAQLLLGVVAAINKNKFADALPVAKALEMVHTYSLIHDDLPAMDNADFRRAHQTIHKKYDEVTAILVGDALNTDAFLVISKSNLSAEIKVKCVEILAKNAGSAGMVLGQAIDCYFEKKHLEISDLKFLHLHKTGALIAASFELGAVIAGLGDEKARKFYGVGLNLGLAFQIQDDIIDATQSSQIAGKPTMHDTDKNSFTNLLGVERAKEYKNSLISQIEESMSDESENLQNLVSNLINKYLKG